MNKKYLKGWLKHWDFILADIIVMQICCLLSYWLIRGFNGNPYQNRGFAYQCLLLFICQIVVAIFGRNYGGILRRKKFEEWISIIKYIVIVLAIAFAWLFAVKDSDVVSRLQVGFTALFFAFIDWGARYLIKKRIYSQSETNKNKKSIVLVTSYRLLDEAKDNLYKTDSFRDFFISRIILMDKDIPSGVEERYAVPVDLLSTDVVKNLAHEWVDEVFILQPDDMIFPTELMEDLMTMGISVNYTMSALFNDKWPNSDIRKLGAYKVINNSIKYVSPGAMALKRVVDIIGGIVGCIFTGVIYIFVAPAIKSKSPGPAFFAQERVGLNGKTFKLYKFRSMYMDAEERKAALMEQNKIKDGYMFKMDDDPRIIGSEKKDKNGKPKGIGNFIRNTSLDEFPQFYNVLRGDMSLVGWRPCTLGEWEKYDLQHRIRAGMRPGITGMWQTSGRSEITDFDEVVALDREYIENWSLALDVKLLLKTVLVVLKREGSA